MRIEYLIIIPPHNFKSPLFVEIRSVRKESSLTLYFLLEIELGRERDNE